MSNKGSGDTFNLLGWLGSVFGYNQPPSNRKIEEVRNASHELANKAMVLDQQLKQTDRKTEETLKRLTKALREDDANRRKSHV